MYARPIAAIVAVFLLAGCDDDQSKKPAATCKGLNEADCQAKSACEWKAEDSKCSVKERDEDKAAESGSSPVAEPPSAPEIAPPQQ
jgi:hypothetical protein